MAQDEDSLLSGILDSPSGGAFRSEAAATAREAELTTYVQTLGREKLRVARREATEAAALRDEFAATLTLALRERRLAANALQDVEEALEEAEQRRVTRESDCKGLRRTLGRIQARLGEAAVVADQVKPFIVKVKEDVESWDVEEGNLRKQVDNITEVRETIRKRLENEREKRLKLKASARAKFDREEETSNVIRRQIDKHKAEIESLKQQMESQRKLTQAAQAEFQKARQEFQATTTKKTDRSEEKRTLQLEVLQMEQEHCKMRQELAQMIATFEERVQKREDARRTWSLNRLAKVDARLEQHRSVDRDILVA